MGISHSILPSYQTKEAEIFKRLFLYIFYLCLRIMKVAQYLMKIESLSTYE